jgi:hypothetical protein
MVRIYNKITGELGSTVKYPYTVDGVLFQEDSTHVLLEIVNIPPENYDKKTHQVIEGAWIIDLEARTYTKQYSVVEKTTYELAVEDWKHMDYTLRIVAPVGLVMDDLGIKFHAWFTVRGYPIERVGEQLYCYCHTIAPEHQYAVDTFQGLITIEDRPT